MDREKITFSTNQPTAVLLDYDDGKLTAGRFGDQYQYVCNNDAAIMWVDPPLRDQIKATGARAGDTVILCRREVRQGNKRMVQWDVAKQEEEPAAAHMPQPDEYQPPRTNGAGQAKPNGHAGSGAPPIAPPVATAPAEEIPPHAQLFECFRRALRCLQEAETYAAAQGYPQRFTSEDVRAVAVHLSINREKGGRA